MSNLIELENEVIYHTYNRLPLIVSKAESCYIYDENGEEYLDFLTGIAVNALGNRHPAILEAITEQLGKYLHLSNYFYQEPQIKLADKLINITNLNKVFFSNSGTESTEGAMLGFAVMMMLDVALG